MSRSDSQYVDDCRKIQQGTMDLQTSVSKISREIDTIDRAMSGGSDGGGNAVSPSEISRIRDLIDGVIEEISDYQAILLRFKEYIFLQRIFL